MWRIGSAAAAGLALVVPPHLTAQRRPPALTSWQADFPDARRPAVAAAMAAGTYSGGRRIITTLGRRITHLDPEDNWDRTRGRIYRLRGKNSTLNKDVNLAAKTSAELVASGSSGSMNGEGNSRNHPARKMPVGNAPRKLRIRRNGHRMLRTRRG